MYEVHASVGVFGRRKRERSARERERSEPLLWRRLIKRAAYSATSFTALLSSLSLSLSLSSAMQLHIAQPSFLSLLMIVVYWPALIHVDILMSHGAVIYRSTELTPSSNSVWTSPIGAFSMGFFSLLPNTYYVGIWYSSLPSNRSIVWTANRNRSVGMNSILHFTHDGRLELISNNSGSVITIWAASTLLFEGIDSNASQAELLDTGNFVLRDNTSRVVWQSFDHPTDTLLPTQNFTFLHNSSSLEPWIAANDPSLSPKYSLVFGSGGSLGRIRLLFQDTFEYWSEPPPGIDDVLFNTSFTMDSMGTLSLYNGNGKQIWVNVSCNESAPATNSMRKLQLSVDGNLQVLTWSTASKSWKPLWKALYFQCDVFDTCGENSICNKNQDANELLGGGCPLPVSQLDQNVCTCPESFTRNGSKCDPPPSLNCSNYTSVMNQTSFGFPGSTKEDFSSLSFEECEEKCLHDCNCTAGSYANSSSSYTNSSSSCWLFRTALHNGVGSGDVYLTSFIKIIANKSANGITDNSLSANGITDNSLPSYAIALIVLSTSLIIILFIAALFIRQKVRSRQSTRFREVFVNLSRLGGPNQFSFQDLFMVTHGFHEDNKLGAGGFGSVYKGTFKTPQGPLEVAIKRLHQFRRRGYENDLGRENRDFMAEIENLAFIKHVNVVNLIGFCAEGTERLLVYEYVANGSLSGHIFSDSSILRWDVRFQIAVDAATGIHYLHAHCPKKVVHRDIKPDNLLLDDKFKAKVADFGLSQIMGPEMTHITNKTPCGTWKYMAPECWHVGALLTEKTDAYSFGMVLLELVSGKMVTKQHYNEQEEERTSATRKKVLPLEHGLEAMERARWESLVDERLEGVYIRGDAERLLRIAFWCLQGNPQQRPAMEDLVDMIKGLKAVDAPSLSDLFDGPLPSSQIATRHILMNSSSTSEASTILPEHLSQGR